MKKQIVSKRKVNKLFDSFKKEDILEDRSEYDEEDLQISYPQLNKKEVKLLYLKIQKWKHSKPVGKRQIASDNKHFNLKD